MDLEKVPNEAIMVPKAVICGNGCVKANEESGTCQEQSMRFVLIIYPSTRSKGSKNVMYNKELAPKGMQSRC